METWLILATYSLTDNISKQPSRSYVKNILCLLIIYFKLKMLQNFFNKSEHAKLTSILLQNLAINSLSVFETEIKIFQNVYQKMFLQSLLGFINKAINFHPLLTEWIFAIPIVHLLTEQHDSLNSVEWHEDHSKFKYAYLYLCKLIIDLFHDYIHTLGISGEMIGTQSIKQSMIKLCILYTYHRWRKVLQVGGAQCSTNIIIICRYIYTWCAKHTQHAKHAPSRGVWRHAPPGNFEKIEARRWDLVAFQPLDKVGKLFIIACNF